MITVGSYVRIIDNSGAKFGQCIRVMRKVGRSYGYVGDIVVITIKKAIPGKKVKKGQVLKGVLVRGTKGRQRLGGDYVNFKDNSIVLINKRKLPIASRVLSAVMSELRDFGFTKIVGLAHGSF
jgi:large subunit ribosomal protein L14